MTPEASARLSLEQAFATAILIRQVEQRLLELFAAGKLFGTVHTCIGQELIGVAVAQALGPGDLIFSNHRCHGHFLARTGNVEGLTAEVMGKATGVCGGRGGSQHLCDRGRGFFSNGIQGGIVPVAAGLAMSLKLRGSDADIAVVFIGDGTLGEGALYESLNVVSKWKLPLLVVLENNGYAQSTSQTQTLAGDIATRARSFDLPFSQSSTWQPEKLLDDVAEAVARVRRERAPRFLQLDTYRLMAHSKSDDDRDPEEIAAYWRKDPLCLFSEENAGTAEVLQERAHSRIDEAVEKALEAPYAQPSPITLELPGGATRWAPAPALPAERGSACIRESLRRNMDRDPRIILLGEDIESPYGGAFKVTKGLSEEFPGRVRNTPISEATIVGLGNGLALGGFIPVCEIMFGDFLTLAADQWINHASKFQYMYNDQVRVPLIVRTPMGGRRGYGPTHSQSLEKHFLGLPNTQVLALHHRCDPGAIYDRLFATIERPTLVIENKLMYAARLDAPAKPGFFLEYSDEPFPTARLRPAERPAVTVFCYGGMLPHVEDSVARAFEDLEIVAEVICPSQLYPLNIAPVVQSVRQTHQLLIVEEGIGFAGLGAELIAQLHEQAPGIIRNCRRLGSPEQPIPSCAILENQLLPSADSILTALRDIAGNV